MRIQTVSRTHPLGAYADASADETTNIEFPADFSALSDEELASLNTRAKETFKGLYGDGSDLTDADVENLSILRDGLASVRAEMSVRDEAREERRSRANELAAGVLDDDEDEDEDGNDSDSDGSDDSEQDGDQDGDDDSDDSEGDAGSGSEQTLASTPRAVRVPTSRTKRHLPKVKEQVEKAATMKDVAFASGEGAGYAPGTGIDFMDAAKIVDKRLAGFSQGAYAAAAKAGKHMRQQNSVMGVRKPIDSDLVIKSDDYGHISEVLNRATSENRLAGNSLVAAGGWCAPSETLYDLLELESRDGIFSLPEVQVSRGGFRRTLGPNFADIYNTITGFHYTEAEDQVGDYDGAGGGSKPCYKVECPEFEEFRLDVDGICITAGLLQSRAYPEVIARTLRGALVAHDHRLSGRALREIEENSTPITMTHTHGAAAPLLESIEMQVEHLRYTQRIRRTATIEGVFPFWTRGVIRADLAERNGVDMLAVSDQQINAWFTMRGISPQFVYNWQDINTLEASAFTGWPTEVTFLLYPAGTWIRGASDIITVDTLFDSTQLRQNDYTALFTEEGWMVVRMGHDSRAVTVPLDADGVTGAQVDLSGPSVAEIPSVNVRAGNETALEGETAPDSEPEDPADPDLNG